MPVRKLEARDFDAWRALARELESLFQGEMAENQEFHAFMNRKIEKGEVLAAEEPGSGNCVGVLAFSTKRNEIIWFGVTERQRGKGAGSALLQAALERLDRTKEICVTTFREGTPGGEQARRLYTKFGFCDCEELICFGLPRVVMKRSPVVKAEAEDAAD